MKKVITISGLLSISLIVFAADKPVRVKGIVCTATKATNGIKPLLIIKDISGPNATLILNMDDGLPDTRKASLHMAYASRESEISPDGVQFTAYTNGSTPQNTTKANLTFKNDDPDVEMTCKDGMAQ